MKPCLLLLVLLAPVMMGAQAQSLKSAEAAIIEELIVIVQEMNKDLDAIRWRLGARDYTDAMKMAAKATAYYGLPSEAMPSSVPRLPIPQELR